MWKDIAIFFFMGLLFYGWTIPFWVGLRRCRTRVGRRLLLISILWLSGAACYAYHRAIQDAIGIPVLLAFAVVLIVEWLILFGWTILFAVGIRKLQKLSGKILIVIAGIWLSCSMTIVGANAIVGELYYKMKATFGTAEGKTINAQPLPTPTVVHADTPTTTNLDWASLLPPVQLHRSNTFAIYPQLTLGRKITGLLFSPDSRYVAAASYGKLKVWDVPARRESHVVQTTRASYIAHVAYNTSNWLVLCVSGNRISVCDILNDTKLLTIPYTNAHISCAATSPDGRYCAVADSQGSISLYDLHSAVRAGDQQRSEPTWSVQATLRAGGQSLAFMPDGTRIASGGKSLIYLLNVADGGLSATMPKLQHEVGTLEFTSDSRYLLVAERGGEIRLYDATTCKLLRIIRDDNRPKQCAALVPNTWTVVAGDGTSESLYMNDLDTTQGTGVVMHTGMGTSILRVAPNGAYAAFGHQDGSVSVWDLKRLCRTPLANCAAIDGTAVAVNHASAAAADAGMRIKIWNLVDGQQSTVLAGPVKSISSVAFSPDARHVYATTHGDFVHGWDLTSKNEHRVMKGLSPNTDEIVVTPDGRYLGCLEDSNY